MSAPPQLAQVAMCSLNLPRTVRFFSEGLGFAPSGSRSMWGERLGRIQGLPDPAATETIVSWLVGRQDFLQLEIFQHTSPPVRPRHDTWRPCDLGWVSFGVVVVDLDACLDRLEHLGVLPLTPPAGPVGRRRVCVEEPASGQLVELVEEHASLLGG